MFYTFTQNNSGGHFVRDTKLDHYVIVEADSLPQAEAIAFSLGIYYDGVYNGHDCNCCGDRWYAPWEVYNVPSHYSSPLTLTNTSTKKNPREHTVVIHYLDGRVIYTTTDCENKELNKLSERARRRHRG